MWHLVILFMFILSFVVFGNNSYHVLSSLIILEYMVLIVYLGLMLNNSMVCSEIYTMISLFVIAATAAGVGLSALIPLTRSHGQDYFSAFNLLW